MSETQIHDIRRKPSGSLNVVSTHKGKTIDFQADHVVSTLSPNVLGEILAPQCPDIVSELRKIPFVSMGIVHLGFSKSILNENGFGYLVPSSEKQKILGVVYDSVTFPQQNTSGNQTRLSVMSGGAHQPWVTSISEDELIHNAALSLRQHLGITADPEYINSLVLENCIPQYMVGHEERVDRIRNACSELFPNLVVSGFGFDGIGMSDRISISKQIALDIHKKYTLGKNDSVW